MSFIHVTVFSIRMNFIFINEHAHHDDESSVKMNRNIIRLQMQLFNNYIINLGYLFLFRHIHLSYVQILWLLTLW